MNFGFSEEQELLRKTARGFIEQNATLSLAREVLEGRIASAAALWPRLIELGWTGLCVPEVYGGTGLSIIEACILIEELGRRLVPVPLVPHLIAATAVCEAGDDEQRAALLPGLAAGDTIGTVCLGASDPSNAPFAEERGGGLVLHGSLRFVPDAERAHLLVASAFVRDSHCLEQPAAWRSARYRRWTRCALSTKSASRTRSFRATPCSTGARHRAPASSASRIARS
jgi:alkylation response protein AidB-like acyl-CoA dehydrogenase